ncbi:MAG: hypothetical protein R6V16_12675 [Bacteroidales bacterium]
MKKNRVNDVYAIESIGYFKNITEYSYGNKPKQGMLYYPDNGLFTNAI